ncbi:retrovirus-related pol polyprotein from transposon TNT 1-94 [Tanacetum coccineum]
MLDSRGLIPGLTATRALVTIQEMADHSHKWHDQERTREYNSYRMNTITDKLKSLNRDMRILKENVHAIKGRYESGDEMHYLSSEEVKFVKATEYREDSLRVTLGNNSPSRNISKLEEILGKYLEESCKRQGTRNFAEKVKRHIKEEQEKGERLLESIEKEPVNTPLVNTIRKTPDYTKCLQELVSKKIKIKEVSMVKLNTRCSAVLQNELPPKEKDPRSFILPCIIGLGTPKPISMVIEMADKSMQSPKGIVENVLVKIDKFIFLMDFVILDIVEDNKVPIILGRAMLATTYARIDVLGKKISLEVGTEKVPEELEETEDLEEFLMNDDINEDLGDFLEEKDLLPKINLDTLEVIPDSGDEMGIRLEDLGEWIEIF